MLKEFKLQGSQTPPLLPSRLRWRLGWPLGRHRATLQAGDCLATRQLLRKRNRIWGSEDPHCASVFLTSSGPLGRTFTVCDPITTLTPRWSWLSVPNTVW